MTTFLLALLGAPALAQPIAPSGVQSAPLSLEVSALLSADRLYLHAPGCTGDSCQAIRKESRQGGEASLWLFPALGFYGGAVHDVESTAAATYSGGGWSVYGGAKGGFVVQRGLAVNGWLSVAHSETTTTQTATTTDTTDGPSDQARRNQFELGAVARFGQSDGGLDAWAGVEAMPYCVDLTRVVHGEAKIGLKPFIPVSAVGGLRIISDPLGGPWSDRGRLSAGVTGEVGYRVGVTGWLTASL